MLYRPLTKLAFHLRESGVSHYFFAILIFDRCNGSKSTVVISHANMINLPSAVEVSRRQIVFEIK